VNHVAGVKAPDARVSPPAAEGPSDSLPEAGAVAEGRMIFLQSSEK